MASIIVYNKDTGERVTWDANAPLPENLTAEKPGKYQVFDRTTNAYVFDRGTWLDEAVRPDRDKALLAADNRVRRYDLQLRAKLSPTETADKIEELLQYMQKLRNLPNNESLTPENLTWPEVP